ncbi:MAG: hypothetical protein SFU21_17030, partial [Flavihumibacter sp.]|nr:hypothetical protein [Flavihumibacter sp.]
RYDLKYRSADGRRDSNNLRQFAYADDYKRGKWMMGTMMAKNNVTGFRIYYGRKFNDSLVPILVGIDTLGNDVYWKKPIEKSSLTNEIKLSYEEGAMDMSQKSPPAPIQSLQRTILLPDWIILSQPMPQNTQSAQ